MRLYGLAVKDEDNCRYIGVYPTLSLLQKVFEEIIDCSEGRIKLAELPTLRELRSELDEHDDFFHEFSDGTQAHVTEIADSLVAEIIQQYYLEQRQEVLA